MATAAEGSHKCKISGSEFENVGSWLCPAAYFVVELSACQARSAKREEGGYIFLVVFAVCGAILPFLPQKKPQRDPFSLNIRRKKIGTGSSIQYEASSCRAWFSWNLQELFPVTMYGLSLPKYWIQDTGSCSHNISQAAQAKLGF